MFFVFGISLVDFISYFGSPRKVVEIVKGSSSTLYGGGAIAGLVNLISKTPEGERELTFILMECQLWDLISGAFSVYANFENFTDTRQTKFGSIYSGPITNPVFKDIYASLDGFIASIGMKIKF